MEADEGQEALDPHGQSDLCHAATVGRHGGCVMIRLVPVLAWDGARVAARRGVVRSESAPYSPSLAFLECFDHWKISAGRLAVVRMSRGGR